jgi:hypothetical protein
MHGIIALNQVVRIQNRTLRGREYEITGNIHLPRGESLQKSLIAQFEESTPQLLRPVGPPTLLALLALGS